MNAPLVDLITRLGGAEATAEALSKRSGRPLGWKGVYKWRERGALPAKWILPLYDEARARGLEVDLEQIAGMACRSANPADLAA